MAAHIDRLLVRSAQTVPKTLRILKHILPLLLFIELVDLPAAAHAAALELHAQLLLGHQVGSLDLLAFG